MTKDIIENDPYKSAGVDIEAGEELINKIKKENKINNHIKDKKIQKTIFIPNRLINIII